MKEKVKTKKDTKLDLLSGNKKIFVIIGAIVILALIITIIYFVMRTLEYKKYEHYEEKMNAYGFNLLYDNGSAKTSEKVTKSEAIKMVIGTCLNTFDISGFAKEPTETYDNAIWVLYAQDANLANATDLNKDTANKKVRYIEVIEYFANAKEKLLKKELVNETDKKISDLSKYTSSQQEAIIDMISNDILKVLESKLKGNKNIFKGQLNEIVVNYIENYDLFGDKVQTDISKLPSNASEYAYISADVAKEVYEMEFIKESTEGFKNPKLAYSDMKQHYTQITDKIQKFYNAILNVDYNTIDVNEFKESIKGLSVSDPTIDNIQKYVNFVKENKIKLEGSAKVQNPIIYHSGMNYKVRVKLDFNIVSSNTDVNILYTDILHEEKIKYKNKEYLIYVDTNVGMVFNSNTYYVRASDIPAILVNTINGIELLNENAEV